MHAHSTRRKQHFFSTYVYREREHGWYTLFLRSCVSLGRINSVQSANNATVQLNCIYRADIPTDIRVFASLLSNGHWFFARSRDCVPTMEKEGKKKTIKTFPAFHSRWFVHFWFLCYLFCFVFYLSTPRICCTQFLFDFVIDKQMIRLINFGERGIRTNTRDLLTVIEKK